MSLLTSSVLQCSVSRRKALLFSAFTLQCIFADSEPWMNSTRIVNDRKLSSYDYLTYRYYAVQPGYNQLPSFPNQVCQAYNAVCADLSLDQCVRVPSEVKVPYYRKLQNGFLTPELYGSAIMPEELDAGRYPGQGYMMLTTVRDKHASQILVLMSNCSRFDCSDCAAGTGLIYYPVLLPAMCSQTKNGAVFSILYNDGTGRWNTESGCLSSFKDLQNRADAMADSTVRLIFIILGIFSLVCVLPCILFLLLRCFWFKPREEPPSSYSSRSSQASPMFSKEQIEEHFPSSTVEGDPPCVVCLCPIEKDQQAILLQCSHPYHKECIVSWWLHKPRVSLECPTCKRKQEGIHPQERPSHHDTPSNLVVIATAEAPLQPSISGVAVEEPREEPTLIGRITSHEDLTEAQPVTEAI